MPARFACVLLSVVGFSVLCPTHGHAQSAAPLSEQDEYPRLTVSSKSVDQARDRLSKSIQRGQAVGMPSLELWEQLLMLARERARALTVDSNEEDQAQAIAAYAESAYYAADTGNIFHIAVVDRDLQILGVPPQERIRILQKAWDAASSWTFADRAEKGPHREETQWKADDFSSYEVSLQNALAAAAAWNAKDTGEHLKDADQFVRRLSKKDAKREVLMRALSHVYSLCKNELDQRSEEGFEVKLRSLTEPTWEWSTLRKGVLLTVTEGAPEEWPLLYLDKVKEKNRSDERWPLHESGWLRVQLSDEATIHRNASRNKVLGVARGWFIPPEPGLYQLIWIVDDGAFLFLNHALLDTTWSGHKVGRPQQTEVVLQKRPYLFEMIGYDFNAGFSLHGYLQRWDGQSWVDCGMDLRLDPDMMERADLFSK